MGKLFEVIAFTASHRDYADAILDYLDKDKKLFHYRLYRQHCAKYDKNIYIKDLRVLGRDLKNVVIVDNAPYSFASQLENGYPIIPFYDSKEDIELLTLATYLKSIKDLEDVRVAIGTKFGLRELTQTSITEYAQYYLATNSDNSLTEQSAESIGTLGDELSPVTGSKVKAELKHLQEDMAGMFRHVKGKNNM